MDILHYAFMIRALEAGLIVALVCPLLGIFLVLRRFALLSDTLAHVSLAGIAIGLLARVNPVWTAIACSVIGSFVIERLRSSKKVYGESALALFLSGSLALAVVLISLAKQLNGSILSYLFGSVVAVTQSDVWTILGVGVGVAIFVTACYRQLVYIAFDEDAAKVSGINVKLVSGILIVLSAITVAISMRVVGVLLVSALIVIPVAAALQYQKNFKTTLLIAEIISVLSTLGGLVLSYYYDLASGGTIVLLALFIFCLSLFWNSGKQ